MEEVIENGKIINKMIPKAINESKVHEKEIKKKLKLNEIFSEFENKATNEFNFYLDESNRRYTKSKCGINLKSLIASTRRKCLDESIKILNDDFYNNNKIIKEEREKMRFKSGKKYYKKIKKTFNVIRNPEIKRKELLNSEENINLDNNIYNYENNREQAKNYKNKNISISYKVRFDIDNKKKDRNKINEVMNTEYNSISKSLENYQSNLKKLKLQYEEKKNIANGKDSYYIKKRIAFNLPQLKLLNYNQKDASKKSSNEDDESKKADIHKLLPFSKYAKYCFSLNPKSNSFNKKKLKEKREATLPNITEPEIPDNNHYYNNYNNTIKVVADSANKEVFVDKNYDKKRFDIENILGVDDIPDLECYEKIAHEKAYSNAKKRKERNELIYKKQNYLRLTSKQKMNFNIERNLNLIRNVENSLWNRKNKND
jgi:hypothetical protein